MRLFSLTNIAAIIASAEGRKADVVHLQCRSLARSGRIKAYSRVGRADIYEYNELLKASILVAAVENGINGSDLTAISSALDENTPCPMHHSDWARTGSGYRYGSGLDTLVRGTQACEDWLMYVNRTRSIVDSSIRTTVEIAPQNTPSPPNLVALKALMLYNGERPVGITTILASFHLSAVLKILERDT